MTEPVSAIADIQSRIAQIQAMISQFVPAAASGTTATTATSGTSTSATDFASALSGTTTTSGSSVTGDQVVADAKKYLGVPYVWGGTTTSGLDCSGLVQKAYGDLGITLPRTSYEQAKVGTSVPSLAQAQPGDILVFGADSHHVAIYLGDNKMIAAPTEGENVQIQSVYETPHDIRRIVGTSADTTATSAVSATGSASSTASSAGISASVQKYDSLFASTESKYNLPSGLLAAVAQTESGGNASAVSPAGAQGLMQLMPTTASGLGVNPWDPSQAVQGAGRLLSGYLNKYGSVPLALAAYNAGSGAVDQYGGIPPYTETQNYVRKITGLMAGASA